MKTGPEDLDALLLPKHHELGNTVRAAIARVSGEADTIEALEDQSLSDVLENIKQRAV